MAPEHVAGKFNIQVQAKTVDHDVDSDRIHEHISGSALLEGIVIAPDADAVTLGVWPAQGDEDSAIALHINPTSADPSETFEVTIGKIPAGATLKYGDDTYTVNDEGVVSKNGVPLTGDKHTVVIDDFDAKIDLSITPPEHGNENFKLDVLARSVDKVEGTDGQIGDTRYSDPETQTIDVRVKGVADAATVEFNEVAFTEADLDGHCNAPGQAIALSKLIKSISMDDQDGSETLSIKLTGFPADFDVSGEGVIFMAGTGADRKWAIQTGNVAQLSATDSTVLEDVLGKVFIHVPEHYNGQLPGTVTLVTTENDGGSWSSTPEGWNATITPSPESELAASSTIDEDTFGKLDFSIDNKGDADETLTALWIKADDVDGGKGFTLYLGKDGMTLKEAAGATDSGVTLEDGYYKLSESDIDNINAKADANLAHNLADAFTLTFHARNFNADTAQDSAKTDATE